MPSQSFPMPANEPYPGGWSFVHKQRQDAARGSHRSTSHDLEDGTLSMTKVTTEPDVEHNEHKHISPGNSDEPTRASSNLQNTRSLLGLHPQAPIDEEHDLSENSNLWWSKVRLALREPFAEFFGTFILVLFGDGSVAQVLLSGGQTSAPGGDGFGSYQSMYVVKCSTWVSSVQCLLT